MTEIIVIVAIAKNNVIGKNNDIPWRIKEDFSHFKEKTLGYPCIMGDKTYESLPSSVRPLPNRENIVLTFDKDYCPKGTTTFNDFNEAIDYVKKKDCKKAFITGGATIYKLGLEVADTLELTIIDKEIDGDIYFPKIDYSQFELVKKEDCKGINTVDNTEVNFSFLTYTRKK
jgi:dihydrofolate reductase